MSIGIHGPILVIIASLTNPVEKKTTGLLQAACQMI